jgi:hypothetical protein
LNKRPNPRPYPRHLLAEVRRQIIAWLVLQNHQRRVVPQAVSRFQHTQDEIGLLAGHETLTGASAERLVESTHVVHHGSPNEQGAGDGGPVEVGARDLTRGVGPSQHRRTAVHGELGTADTHERRIGEQF